MEQNTLELVPRHILDKANRAESIIKNRVRGSCALIELITITGDLANYVKCQHIKSQRSISDDFIRSDTDLTEADHEQLADVRRKLLGLTDTESE